MAAAADGVTGVIGAWVSIVTAEVPRAWLTHPLPTGVNQGAGVLVIAGRDVGDVDAAFVVAAAVGRTRVVVIAVERDDARAHALLAGVGVAACFAVITGQGVGDELAARCSVTGVIGAGVLVVTC